jgi:hypothetical protein
MKRLPELDFALNRAQRAHQRKVVIVVMTLLFAFQLGAVAWRWMSFQDERTEMIRKYQQLNSKRGPTDDRTLTADQASMAVSAQKMLNSFAVPWEALLQAVESARPQRIVVETIQPSVTDSSVKLAVTSPDFAELALFVNELQKQEALHGVMLVSEAMSDNGGSTLRAVIHANWQPSQ